MANYFGQGWSAVIVFAFIPVYIRHLGLESYGLIGLMSVALAWFSLLDMGIGPTLTREMARFTAGSHSVQSIRDLLRSLELVYLAAGAIIAASVRLTAPLLARHWLHFDTLPPAIVVEALSIMGFVVALRFLEGIYRGCLFGLQRQVLYNGINGLVITLRQGGAALVVAYISPTIHAFFMWQAAVSLLSVVVLGTTVHRTLPRPPAPPRFSRRAVAGVLHFAAGMIGITFLSLLLTQADKLLLSRLLPLETFGGYMLATSVAGVLMSVVAPVSQALYPRLVELAGGERSNELIATYHDGCQLITAFTAPVALLLSLYANGVIFMWSGDAALASRAGPILSILAAGSFLNTLMYLPYQLQLAFGWTQLGIRTNSVAVVVLVPAIWWIAPRYGATGTATIWLLLNAGYILGSIQLMHLRLLRSEKREWYLRDVMLPLAGASIAGVASLAVRPAPGSQRIHWFVFLFITGVAMMVGSVSASSRLRGHVVAAARRVLAPVLG